MAGLTPVVQHSHDVIGIRRLLIISLVTRIAICIDQLIIVIRVAFLALSCGMLPRKCKLRCIVVKRSRFPSIRGVTLCAGLRIPLRLVVWVSCPNIICPMAIDAIHRQRGKLVVDVTNVTQNRLVRTSQWELCVVMGK